jgi:transcription elongation factor Elf1
MLKTCCTCHVRKPTSAFNRRARSKDGLQQICRDCSAASSRRYHQNHTEAHRKFVRKRRAEKRREFKQRTDEIKRRFGCRVCGESDVVCLEFHHLDPDTKDFEIAQAMVYEWAWEKVLAEIRKCACLCANCHRKVHAGRFEVTEDMLCDV